MSDRSDVPGVARDGFRSTDPAEITAFLGARFTDDVVVNGVGRHGVEYGYEAVATDGLAVGHTWTTLATVWEVGPLADAFLVQHMRTGRITHSGRVFGDLVATPGDTVVVPPAGEFRDVADAHDMDFVVLDREQVDWFAECAYGIGEGDLRVIGLRPHSEQYGRYWTAAVSHVRDDVLGNPMLTDSAILLDQAFRRLAAAFLVTFPNTALTAVTDRRTRTARRVSESSVRAVREYLRDHAGEPVGPQQIASVAGAPADDVLAALVRQDGRHPAHLLWEARLHGARRTLLDADPSTTDVAAVAARWGFARLPAFRLVYGKAFGEAPEDTLG